MLKPGQMVRISDGIFRVDYVNACRARITPVGNRKVTRFDGTEFMLHAQSISPNSPLEIVTDIDAMRDKIELEQAERELKLAKKAMVLAKQQQARDREELAKAEADLVAARAEAEAAKAARKANGLPEKATGGWFAGPTEHPHFRAGTLAATVMSYIKANPGKTTKEIVAGVPSDAAVAACVSRFGQAGYIHKV